MLFLQLVVASLLQLIRCTLIAQQRCHLSQCHDSDRSHAKEVLRLWADGKDCRLQVGSVGVPEYETVLEIFPDPAQAAPPQFMQLPSGVIQVITPGTQPRVQNV